jgi:hypothetical protein
MNDDDLITLVRQQRDQLPMDVSVEQITRRGRAVRARRRVPRRPRTPSWPPGP